MESKPINKWNWITPWILYFNTTSSHYICTVKKFIPYLKNKYILTSLIFLLYGLFLDDIDVFTIARQKKKLAELEKQTVLVKADLEETKAVLNELKYTSELERFAREKKLFKRDDEDVFVISYE